MKKLVFILGLLVGLFIFKHPIIYTELTVTPEHNDITYTTYSRVFEYMRGETLIAFSKYYEVTDLEISNYEEITEGNFQGATFVYTIRYKNYDKDPDTVSYIKKAKEENNPNYQQMYDDYTEPKEMNIDLKVTFDFETTKLYTNISPKGIKWVETKMTGFVGN